MEACVDIYTNAGEEITLQIIESSIFVTDLNSLKNNEANAFILEGLEPCTILGISLSEMNTQKKENLVPVAALQICAKKKKPLNQHQRQLLRAL
ncbi:MAG: hypothetical protein ABJA37_07625 [Ferruginibacter sp.]